MKPVHFSTLKWMAKSPAHYRYYSENPPKPSPAMMLGTAVHAAVLSDWRGMVIWEGPRRGKVWESFQAEHAGKDIITTEEFELARRIADAVLENDHVDRLLSRNLVVEEEVLFQIGDRACSVRPDAFCEDYVVELKTTADANPAKFPYLAQRMGYHAQLAWQMDGIWRGFFNAWSPKRAYIIAVETKPPFVVQVFELTPFAIDYGRKLYSLWFEQLLNCERSGVWPGYLAGIAPLEGPPGSDALPLLIDGEEVTL